jgi:hypothetical protein
MAGLLFRPSRSSATKKVIPTEAQRSGGICISFFSAGLERRKPYLHNWAGELEPNQESRRMNTAAEVLLCFDVLSP